MSSPSAAPCRCAATRQLVEQNVQLLRQAEELIERTPEALYAAPALGMQSIGPHFRHCFDFYFCLLRGMSEGRVDYNARRQGCLVETSRAAALREVSGLIAAMSVLADIRHELRVRAELGPDDEAGSEVWFDSSLDRELEFLQSHTTHHYALIALMARAHGVAVGAQFGYARSTLRRLQQEPGPCVQ